jgi:hypothetical protein
MSRIWNRYGIVALLVGAVVGGLAVHSQMRPDFARAEEKPPIVDSWTKGGAHYTVIETEGHNLIVTDNATSTLYFYAVDKGEAVGSELKLRASLDLTQIGKDTIKPKPINIQRKD